MLYKVSQLTEFIRNSFLWFSRAPQYSRFESNSLREGVKKKHFTVRLTVRGLGRGAVSHLGPGGDLLRSARYIKNEVKLNFQENRESNSK